MGKRLILLWLLSVCAVHATTLLTVSNDGGASNRTSTSAYLGGIVVTTNGLTVTNIFYDGATDGTNVPASWTRWTTNVTVGFGLVQTNLTMPSGATRYYRFSSIDLSGQVFAASSVAFTTPSSTLSTNLNTPLGTVEIPTNSGARHLIMPSGSSIFITGVGTLGTGSGAITGVLANIIGDANINVQTNLGVASITPSNNSPFANLILKPVTNAASAKSNAAIVTNNDNSTLTFPNATVGTGSVAAALSGPGLILASNTLFGIGLIPLSGLNTNGQTTNYVLTVVGPGNLVWQPFSPPPSSNYPGAGVTVFDKTLQGTNLFRGLASANDGIGVAGNAAQDVFTLNSDVLRNGDANRFQNQFVVQNGLTLLTTGDGTFPIVNAQKRHGWHRVHSGPAAWA